MFQWIFLAKIYYFLFMLFDSVSKASHIEFVFHKISWSAKTISEFFLTKTDYFVEHLEQARDFFNGDFSLGFVTYISTMKLIQDVILEFFL